MKFKNVRGIWDHNVWEELWEKEHQVQGSGCPVEGRETPSDETWGGEEGAARRLQHFFFP